MNNKTIIEFGFRIIWRIMEISGGVIRLGPQPHSLIVNYFIGSLGSLKINQQLIQWISSSKLLVVTIDNKLTWTKHISELKRGFVNKLNLIKRSRF